MKSRVAVFSVKRGIKRSVAEALDAVQWGAVLEQGKDCCFKVNLTHDLLLPGAIVSPAVTRAAYEHMKDFLGQITLTESSQVVTDADKAYRTSGYEALLRPLGLPWHNMTHHPYSPAAIDGEELLLPDIVRTQQVVNICVMKTHFRSVISGALKNFWGFLETGRERFHVDLSRKIAQLHTLIGCRLHLMDAVVAMEGNGPKSGSPKEVGLILASRDPVALDAVAAHLMGFDPQEIDHIQECARRGLGIADLNEIERIGDAADMAPLDFKPARENFVARIEGRMRKLRGEGRQLRGTPLQIMSTGAKLWYAFAYRAFGTERRVRRFLAQTRYQGEWGDYQNR